ncbi:MAG: hypothetical protein V1736_03965 [Pseudomonadota bacterium]
MIGPKTISRMKHMVSEQIDAFAMKIDEAYIKAYEGKLKVTLSIDLCTSTVKATGIDIDCSIGFIADRVKDKISDTVIENQIELPLADKVYRLKGD